MTGEVTYLEFSDAGSNSQKFYEVSVAAQTLTVRFGRVHTQGTTQTKTYPTFEQAQAEARKRIREKQRKGYQIRSTVAKAVTPAHSEAPNSQPALPVVSGDRLPSVSSPEPISPERAPILWRFDSGSSTFGLAVESEHCWLGNEKGQVFKLDRQGQILQQYQLPDAVKCIVTDDIWIYAGCDNGNVYDLTGKFPYLAYELEKGVDIFWLAIYDGMLGVSDANGGITKTDPEGEILWTRLSSGKMGWMLCCDAQGFYHGHSKGVTGYDFSTGRQIWHQPTHGKVLFGCQSGDHLYVATSGKQIQSFSTDGTLLESYPCGASVYACTTDSQGQYLYASDSSAFIYCFSQQGQLLWKVSTGCGSALSIQWFDDRLYIVTNQGVMACLDISTTALQSARNGNLPLTASVTHPASLPTQTATTLEIASEPTQGVVLECFREGQKLRVRAVSEGYCQDWMVQFPRDIRREGDRYWVEALKEAKQGGYYRTYGEIKRLG
ncbi:WGR domain-containing protein [Pseudanabaena sp. PCC 6802]|uniref:WGR domain-containing protein n=1 Tax=Pseudanabaena sp. PCC 6802 TaxID=118173 RepID=UPI000346DB4C|nr:WGR domain-containing protein [Pseudanabaena sp. PCC 6802]